MTVCPKQHKAFVEFKKKPSRKYFIWGPGFPNPHALAACFKKGLNILDVAGNVLFQKETPRSTALTGGEFS